MHIEKKERKKERWCRWFISVSAFRPKAKQRLLREVRARAGNPPASSRALAFSSVSSGVAEDPLRAPQKHTKNAHSDLYFRRCCRHRENSFT